MTAKCFALVNGRRLRMTKLDNCGRPVDGPCSTIVSSGWITATLSGEIDEGDEIERKNAAGELCVSRPPCPIQKWTTVEIEFCMVDPDLFAMMNPKWKLLKNGAGDAIGVAMGRDFSCDAGFALEIWTDVEGEDICDNPDAEGAWGYILLPWMSNGFLSGDVAVANDAITFTFSAKTRIKSKWGAGPYHVQLDEANNAPGPLFEPVEAWEDHRIMIVDMAPPDAGCGCTPLSLTPPYVPPQSATEGAPGSWTPSTSVPPTIAQLKSDNPTASPTTAWTGWNNLGDGNHAMWDGDSWELAVLTTVTMGTPGTFSPSNAKIPATVAELNALPVLPTPGGITISPNVPWDQGTYVVLAAPGNLHAYWDGSLWQAGEGP